MTVLRKARTRIVVAHCNFIIQCNFHDGCRGLWNAIRPSRALGAPRSFGRLPSPVALVIIKSACNHFNFAIKIVVMKCDRALARAPSASSPRPRPPAAPRRRISARHEMRRLGAGGGRARDGGEPSTPLPVGPWRRLGAGGPATEHTVAGGALALARALACRSSRSRRWLLCRRSTPCDILIL